MNIEEKITKEALQLGFAVVGFASVGTSESFDIFKDWLNSGRAGDMEYLNGHHDLRLNPVNVFSPCKSVIVLGAGYPVNSDPGKGFSCYARGLDYHNVMRRKLKQLLMFIKKEDSNSVGRVCVDSAPVFEREWAVRAGIGWRGKQGQIVNAKIGCCFFIGVILVNMELNKSVPLENRCGECRSCMDACPTGAICKDGLVDARKCISYLTIEHKGCISEYKCRKMGESIFGCDFCTAICPWNKSGSKYVMAEFRERSMPSVEDCLNMTEEEFEVIFKDTAVFRTGLKKIQQNARNISRF